MNKKMILVIVVLIVKAAIGYIIGTIVEANPTIIGYIACIIYIYASYYVGKKYLSKMLL